MTVSSKLANIRALKEHELELVNGGCPLSDMVLPGGMTMSGANCALDDEGLSATSEFDGPD